MQLKQETQRLWSMCTLSGEISMHWALHFLSQLWQRTHWLSSIIGRNMEKRERKLSVVPTGQMELQYVRPPLKERATMTTSVPMAIRREGTLLSHTSFS